MRINPHPLTPAQIEPAPAPYPVDALTEPFYRREGVRPGERALPTVATTRGHRAWKWGRAVDRPSSASAPVIFSPSDLEPGRTPESPTYGTLDELRRRLKP
jgi:hypothetical protein